MKEYKEEQIIFQKGDLVWAKLRGYSWWPGQVSGKVHEGKNENGENKIKLIVNFIGSNYQHATLDMDKVVGYKKYFNTYASKSKNSKLAESIDVANQIIEGKTTYKDELKRLQLDQSEKTKEKEEKKNKKKQQQDQFIAKSESNENESSQFNNEREFLKPFNNKQINYTEDDQTSWCEEQDSSVIFISNFATQTQKIEEKIEEKDEYEDDETRIEIDIKDLQETDEDEDSIPEKIKKIKKQNKEKNILSSKIKSNLSQQIKDKRITRNNLKQKSKIKSKSQIREYQESSDEDNHIQESNSDLYNNKISNNNSRRSFDISSKYSSLTVSPKKTDCDKTSNAADFNKSTSIFPQQPEELEVDFQFNNLLSLLLEDQFDAKGVESNLKIILQQFKESIQDPENIQTLLSDNNGKLLLCVKQLLENKSPQSVKSQKIIKQLVKEIDDMIEQLKKQLFTKFFDHREMYKSMTSEFIPATNEYERTQKNKDKNKNNTVQQNEQLINDNQNDDNSRSVSTIEIENIDQQNEKMDIEASTRSLDNKDDDTKSNNDKISDEINNHIEQQKYSQPVQLHRVKIKNQKKGRRSTSTEQNIADDFKLSMDPSSALNQEQDSKLQSTQEKQMENEQEQNGNNMIADQQLRKKILQKMYKTFLEKYDFEKNIAQQICVKLESKVRSSAPTMKQDYKDKILVILKVLKFIVLGKEQLNILADDTPIDFKQLQSQLQDRNIKSEYKF